MIGEGQGDVAEQADDDSNTDIYLNMSSDGIEPPSIQDDAATEESVNVHITTILICSDNHIFIRIYMNTMNVFYSHLDHRRSRKRRSEAQQKNWKGGSL